MKALNYFNLIANFVGGEEDFNQYFSTDTKTFLKELYFTSSSFEKASIYHRYPFILDALSIDTDTVSYPDGFKGELGEKSDIVFITNTCENNSLVGFYFECLYANDYSIFILDSNSDLQEVPHSSYLVGPSMHKFLFEERQKLAETIHLSNIKRWKENGLSPVEVLEYESILTDSASANETLQNRFTDMHTFYYLQGKEYTDKIKKKNPSDLTELESFFLHAINSSTR